MAEKLEVSHLEFKTMMDMIRALVNKIDNMQEQRQKF
jgi:hypothetical protein